MKNTMRLFVLGLLALGISNAAQAGSRAPMVPAHTMTCEEAVVFYQTYKRIYVLANGKDLVPLYGMTPIAERSKLVCRGRGKMKAAYWIRTTDTSSCVIAVRCQ